MTFPELQTDQKYGAEMTDQANALRDLMVQHQTAVPDGESEMTQSRAHTIVITSGKGGVGKSNIALNLGVALAETELSVCLLDANLGLGNIDLLCGLNGYWNLSHVVTGARALQDVILEGPSGLNVIPGAGSLNEVAGYPVSTQNEILSQLRDIEQKYDVLLIDTGTAVHDLARRFVSAADFTVVVTTPEPTSIADAYSTIKSFSAGNISHLQILVNEADSSQQARAILERLQQTARLFVRSEVDSAGFILRDQHVPQAVTSRSPFIVSHPQCPAADGIRQLARRMKNMMDTRPAEGDFFSRLWEESLSKAA